MLITRTVMLLLKPRVQLALAELWLDDVSLLIVPVLVMLPIPFGGACDNAVGRGDDGCGAVVLDAEEDSRDMDDCGPLLPWNCCRR